jgi:20S proteasome alpha/beta subunit
VPFPVILADYPDTTVAELTEIVTAALEKALNDKSSGKNNRFRYFSSLGAILNTGFLLENDGEAEIESYFITI